MRMLRDAVTGDPVQAQSPEGEPAFWLVPLQIGLRACGFARVDLSGRVAQIGRFSGGDDQTAWPEADFFKRPLPRLLDEIRAKHAGIPLAEPLLSYDGSPAKWAWRVAIGTPAVAVAYLTPGGWYEKPAAPVSAEDREG